MHIYKLTLTLLLTTAFVINSAFALALRELIVYTS